MELRYSNYEVRDGDGNLIGKLNAVLEYYNDSKGGWFRVDVFNHKVICDDFNRKSITTKLWDDGEFRVLDDATPSDNSIDYAAIKKHQNK